MTWLCPQKGSENRSTAWQIDCRECCSVCQHRCSKPPCCVDWTEQCAWRRTETEMVLERIFGPDVHMYYYKLRQYEYYKSKGIKSSDVEFMTDKDSKWEAQFMRNFEKKWGKPCQ